VYVFVYMQTSMSFSLLLSEILSLSEVEHGEFMSGWLPRREEEEEADLEETTHPF